MFLGVDVGTTGIKACLVDLEGNVLAKAYRKLRMYGLEANRRELDPHQIIDLAKEAMREAAGPGAGEVQVITVSSLGEAIVPVDRGGQAPHEQHHRH